jgi:ATP synthase F1 delta subunit
LKDLFIIKKYSRSVIELIPADKYDACLSDCQNLIKIFSEYTDLVEVLNTELIREGKKKELCIDLARNLEFSDMWSKLFLLLIHNGRFNKILQIITSIQHGIYLKMNTVIVKLHLARKQDDQTVKRIIAYLKKVINKEVIAEIQYNKDLLGGFYAETDTMIVDGSLKNNLMRFANLKQQKQFK